MSTNRRLSRPSIVVLAVALAGLAACQKRADQAATNPAQAPPPLAAMALTSDATLPPAAPATDALPAAPPIQTASLAGPPDASYAYVDRAYEVNDGFGDAPPDYGFDYDGGQPWTWRSDDGYERVDEPVNGGDRDYYYEPNSDDPFLVRDDDYSYGYRGGILVVVYDREGRPLPADQYGRYSDRAARLFLRARQLHAAEQQQPHRGVGSTPWEQRRGVLTADRQAWIAQQQNNPDWRAYHDQSAPQYAAFDVMRARREAEAVRVDQTLQDRQAEARDRQAAQRAQTIVQALTQTRGGAPGGFHPPAPPTVAQSSAMPAPAGQGPQPGAQARVQAEQQQQTQAQARLQAQQKADIASAAAASQAQQARAQAAVQRQAQAQADAAKARSDALGRQAAAQQARVQAQQQAATQAQARAQALSQQNRQAAAQRQAQQAAAAQQRSQALAQQQSQVRARQAAQQQAAGQAQARAQAAAQQRAQAQAAAQQQRQAAIQARKAAAAPSTTAPSNVAAHAKHRPNGQPTPQ